MGETISIRAPDIHVSLVHLVLEQWLQGTGERAVFDENMSPCPCYLFGVYPLTYGEFPKWGYP